MLIRLLVIVALASCSKDKSDRDKPFVPSTTTLKQEAAVDELALLPIDSEMTVGINFAKLRPTPLWKQLVEPEIAKHAPELRAFKLVCGFDPIQAIENISAGLKNVEKDPEGVLIVRGLDRQKVFACYDLMKKEGGRDADDITRDGDVITIKGDVPSETLAFGFVNDKTAVGVLGIDANRKTVEAAAAGRTGLRTSPTFVEAFGKLESDRMGWIVVSGNSSMLSDLGDHPQIAYGSVNIPDGVSAEVRIQFTSADQAKQLADGLKGELGFLAGMVDTLKVRAEGNDLRISVSVSRQKLLMLARNFGPGLLEDDPKP
jgi:hypothetical protein